MTTQTQPTAEQIITSLKAKLFDYQEHLAAQEKHLGDFSKAMQEIAARLDIVPDENGNIVMETILETISALKAPKEEASE